MVCFWAIRGTAFSRGDHHPYFHRHPDYPAQAAQSLLRLGLGFVVNQYHFQGCGNFVKIRLRELKSHAEKQGEDQKQRNAHRYRQAIGQRVLITTGYRRRGFVCMGSNSQRIKPCKLSLNCWVQSYYCRQQLSTCHMINQEFLGDRFIPPVFAGIPPASCAQTGLFLIISA